MKFFTVYDFVGMINEEIDHQVINQHIYGTHKIHIINQWTEMKKKHYNAESTARIYGAWHTILQMCQELLP